MRYTDRSGNYFARKCHGQVVVSGKATICKEELFYFEKTDLGTSEYIPKSSIREGLARVVNGCK